MTNIKSKLKRGIFSLLSVAMLSSLNPIIAHAGERLVWHMGRVTSGSGATVVVGSGSDSVYNVNNQALAHHQYAYGGAWLGSDYYYSKRIMFDTYGSRSFDGNHFYQAFVQARTAYSGSAIYPDTGLNPDCVYVQVSTDNSTYRNIWTTESLRVSTNVYSSDKELWSGQIWANGVGSWRYVHAKFPASNKKTYNGVTGNDTTAIIDDFQFFSKMSDTVGPTGNAPTVSNITSDSYDVTVTGVADNFSGVSAVNFPTWTDYNGQDELIWHGGTHLGNGVWKYTVPRSAHNGEWGIYRTHVYAYDQDWAGNNRYLGEVTVNMRDLIAPTMSLSQSTSAWTNGNVTITATASDTYTGVAKINTPGGDVASSTATYTATANGTYTFTAYDGHGNTVAKSVSITNIDKTVPTLSVTSSNTANTNGNITLTATASDGGSGIYQVQKPDGTWVSATSTTYTVTSNGTYSFVAKDNVGNTKTTSITVSNIDKDAPDVDLSQNTYSWTNQPVIIDALITDVKNQYTGQEPWYNNGGTSTNVTSTEPGPVSGSPTFKWVKTGTASQWHGWESDYDIFSGNTGDKWIVSAYYKTTAPAGIGNFSMGAFYTMDWSRAYNTTVVDQDTRIIADGQWHYVYSVIQLNENMPMGIVADGPSWNYSTQAGTLYINGLQWRKIPNGQTVDNGVSIQKYASGSQTASYFASAGTVMPTTDNFSVSSNGTYTVFAQDSVGNQTVKTITVGNIDTTAPTATVTPSTTSNTNGNVVLSVSATDSQSGVDQIQLPNGNWVDGSSASYTVSANGTYSFVIKDNVGNQTTKSITISNIDKTAPTLTLTPNPSSWTKGSVTITATATDNLVGVSSITLPNGTVVAGGSTSYVVSTNGTYTFKTTDALGNVGTQNIVISKIDGVNPTGAITPSTTAWTNSNITLTVSASDNLSGVASIKKPDATTSTGASTTYIVNANGTYSFEITDNAGNVATISQAISNIDKIAPTVTLTQNPTTWTKGSVTITVSATDSQSGVANIEKPDATIVAGGSTTYVVSTNGTYSFDVTDNAGNVTTKSIVIDDIDVTAPVTTLAQNITANTNSDIIITANASDTQSGVKQIKLPNGTIVSASTATYTVSANGTYSFETTDNVGNISTKTITVSNIDKVAPTVTLTQNPIGWTKGSVTITVSATDNLGIANIKLPNATVVAGSSTTYIVSTNGTYSFEVTDTVGNITTKSIAIDDIDTTAPNATLTQNSSVWTAGSVTITVNATDTQSGVASIKKPDNAVVAGGSTTYVVSVNGTYNFEITDNVGNTVIKTITIDDIDTTAPTVTSSVTTTAWTNQDVIISISASDTQSGVKNIKLPSGTLVTGTSTTYTATANGTYSFEISDNVGNITTKVITVSNIDKALPDGTVTPSSTVWTKQDVVLTINATDIGGSNVVSIKLPNANVVSGSSTTYTVSANGTYSFEITDGAGNKVTKSITVSNIDITAPNSTLTQSPISTQWTNGSVTITVNGTDSQSGVQSIKKPDTTVVSGSTTTYVVSANGTYSFEITDNVGNKSTKAITISNIDKSLPTLTLNPNITSWTNGNVVITATAVDTGGSGVSNIKLPDNNLVTGSTASFTISANGTYSFEVTDVAGNKTTKTITISNIDTTGASITLTPSTTAWTNQNISISVSSTDSQSGVKDIKLPNGTIVTGSTATFTVGSNGTYSFEVTDIVGNKSTQSIIVSNIDKVVPSLDLSANSLITNLTVTISANAFDGQSGVKSIKLPNGQIVNDEVATYTVSTNGAYTFEVEDIAGNKITSSITVGNIIVINPVSGINRTEYKLEGATVQDWTVYLGPFNVTNEGITTIKARMVDNAGNVSNEATSIVKIDRSKPLNGTVEIIVK